MHLRVRELVVLLHEAHSSGLRRQLKSAPYPAPTPPCARTPPGQHTQPSAEPVGGTAGRSYLRASPGSHCYHPFVRHPSADSESQSATGRRAVTGEMSEGCTPKRAAPPGRCAAPRAPIQGPRTPRTLENPSGPAAAPAAPLRQGCTAAPPAGALPDPPPYKKHVQSKSMMMIRGGRKKKHRTIQ